MLCCFMTGPSEAALREPGVEQRRVGVDTGGDELPYVAAPVVGEVREPVPAHARGERQSVALLLRLLRRVRQCLAHVGVEVSACRVGGLGLGAVEAGTVRWLHREAPGAVGIGKVRRTV